MPTFYPGPSKVYSKVAAYMQDAFDIGVVSINHRSPEFIEISKTTIALLKEKLNIPESYTIFYTASATECWEIIAQSLVKEKSFHIYNGAFGKKWFQYTKKLKPKSIGISFDENDKLDISGLQILNTAELICLTQNETSNSTEISNEKIAKIKAQHPEKLFAIDATSSMGGIELEFQNADIWYASVQKCFGLPAGLALMICAPPAIKKALEIGENDHYNSLSFMVEKMKKFQTTHTPNVLNIYLLMRIMQDAPPIKKIHEITLDRFHNWIAFINPFTDFKLLISNPAVQSKTVLTIEGEAATIAAVKEKAKAAGIMLGNGYGDLKDSTFRIANFPAITEKEIEELQVFLKGNFE